MTRSKGSSHPVARRLAIASMTVLTASGVGLVAAPMAFGQIVVLGGSSQGATVTNAGSASANTGGNTAIGNASTNTISQSAPGGGLIDIPITLGGPTNTSDGSAAVTTGPATAAGNSSDTAVGQTNSSGGVVSGFLTAQNQGAGVTNAGSASANSGGNLAVGNGSQNTITQDVSGGVIGVGVNLGAPINNSTGRAAINSGEASAVGNDSSTEIGQASLRGGAGGPGGGPGGARAGVGGAGVGPGPCAGGRFGSFQNVNVANRGEAEANTGNNVAVGNASTNDIAVSAPQTVSGGLLGVGITIGAPINNSTGTAVINTGPATAVGNSSTTEVSQFEGCPQVTTLVAGRQPVVVHPAAKVVHARPGATLARTGLDTADLGMIAGAALGMGILLVATQRRRFTARHAEVPMAGFGFGMGTNTDWDGPVR